MRRKVTVREYTQCHRHCKKNKNSYTESRSMEIFVKFETLKLYSSFDDKRAAPLKREPDDDSRKTRRSVSRAQSIKDFSDEFFQTLWATIVEFFQWPFRLRTNARTTQNDEICCCFFDAHRQISKMLALTFHNSIHEYTSPLNVRVWRSFSMFFYSRGVVVATKSEVAEL